jgi:hypothetical protein
MDAGVCRDQSSYGGRFLRVSDATVTTQTVTLRPIDTHPPSSSLGGRLSLVAFRLPVAFRNQDRIAETGPLGLRDAWNFEVVSCVNGKSGPDAGRSRSPRIPVVGLDRESTD